MSHLSVVPDETVDPKHHVGLYVRESLWNRLNAEAARLYGGNRSLLVIKVLEDRFPETAAAKQ